MKSKSLTISTALIGTAFGLSASIVNAEALKVSSSSFFENGVIPALHGGDPGEL